MALLKCKVLAEKVEEVCRRTKERNIRRKTWKEVESLGGKMAGLFCIFASFLEIKFHHFFFALAIYIYT